MTSALLQPCSQSNGVPHWFEPITVQKQSTYQKWVEHLLKFNPSLSCCDTCGRKPKILWICCADLRNFLQLNLPATCNVEQFITSDGSLSIHVHQAASHDAPRLDVSWMSIVECLVNSQQCDHIIVYSSYQYAAISDEWHQQAKMASTVDQSLLNGMTSAEQQNRLCELNVIEQTFNICAWPAVQAAWQNGQDLHVQGVVCDFTTGLLTQLVGPISSVAPPLPAPATMPSSWTPPSKGTTLAVHNASTGLGHQSVSLPQSAMLSTSPPALLVSNCYLSTSPVPRTTHNLHASATASVPQPSTAPTSLHSLHGLTHHPGAIASNSRHTPLPKLSLPVHTHVVPTVSAAQEAVAGSSTTLMRSGHTNPAALGALPDSKDTGLSTSESPGTVHTSLQWLDCGSRADGTQYLVEVWQLGHVPVGMHNVLLAQSDKKAGKPLKVVKTLLGFVINNETAEKYHILQGADGQLVLLRKSSRGSRGGKNRSRKHASSEGTECGKTRIATASSDGCGASDVEQGRAGSLDRKSNKGSVACESKGSGGSRCLPDAGEKSQVLALNANPPTMEDYKLAMSSRNLNQAAPVPGLLQVGDVLDPDTELLTQQAQVLLHEKSELMRVIAQKEEQIRFLRERLEFKEAECEEWRNSCWQAEEVDWSDGDTAAVDLSGFHAVVVASS